VPSMDIAASMDGATAANDRRARSPGVTKRRLAAGAEAPDCTGSRSTGGRELMAKLGAGSGRAHGISRRRVAAYSPETTSTPSRVT
jgi:hypothetical protein